MKHDHREVLVAACDRCGADGALTSPLLLLGVLPDVPIVSVDDWAADDAGGRARVEPVVGGMAPPVPGLIVAVQRLVVPTLLEASDANDLRRRLRTGSVAEPLATAHRELEFALDAVSVTRATLAAFLSLGPESPPDQLEMGAEELRRAGTDAVIRYVRHNCDALASMAVDARIGIRVCRFVERLASGTDPVTARDLLRTGIDAVVSDEILPEYRAAVADLSSGATSDEQRCRRLGRLIELAGALGDTRAEAHWLAERAMTVRGDAMFVPVAVETLAESDLRRAIELVGDGDAPELRARVEVNLAGVLSGRSTGDRSENMEEAIDLLHRALECFTEEAHPDAWAMTSTNLSVAYVRRRAGTRSENLRAAESLCRAALRVRSPQRNSFDWAFTTANLAYALIEQVEIGDGELDDRLDRALVLSERAATAFSDVGARQQAADALHNAAAAARSRVRHSLTRQARRAAESIATEPEVVDALARVDLTTGSVPDRIVRIAELSITNPRSVGFPTTPEWAVGLVRPPPTDADRDLLERGMRLSARAKDIRSANPGAALAVSCVQWDDLLQLADAPVEERITVLEEGLTPSSVDDLPDQVLDLASRLGGLHSDRREWSRAADAYSRAISALDRIHDELADQTARLAELSAHYKLVEFAAYASAMAGREAEAVRLLENGRTRGLGADVARDSSLMSRLRTTAPATAAELDRIQGLLADRPGGGPLPPASETGPSSAALRAELRGLLERIRVVEEFSGFMTGVSAREIAEASRPDRPLVYLVATPVGSAALLVEPGDRRDGLRVTPLFSGVTSTDLVNCVSRFDADGQCGVLVSTGDELDDEIRQAQRLLGAAFGQGLMHAVLDRGATEVLVVPGGILATLPLTTAEVWSERGALPLSEVVSVAVTPSAYVHRVCVRRAGQRARSPRLLVAAGDPHPHDPGWALPWSRAEVRAIGQLHDTEHRSAVGADATVEFLRTHSGQASVLHLSLHGFSDLGSPMRSGVALADGMLTAAQLRATTELTAQIVVVSACESGRISIGEAPNEFRGLPFALIACGAASVVASLWSVSDHATSLLMVRFHEELVQRSGTTRPAAEVVPSALQAAQTWLRSATSEDVARFRERHRLVRADRDDGRDTRGAASRTVDEPDSGAGARHPFDAPRHWAPFIAIV